MNPSGPGTSDRSHDPHHAAQPGVTRNEYDALADLFLGDAAFSPGHAAPVSTPTLTHTPAAPHTVSQPLGQNLHLAGQPAVYPERTTPPNLQSSAMTPNVWRLVGEPVSLDQPMQARAAHENQVSQAAPQSAAQTVTVEAIVQGHLPIFASAWVPQYARSIAADTRSAVALIRVRHGQISVERFAADVRSSAPLPKYATLAEAIESAVAPRVLLQVDELAEPDLWRTPGLDRITVLTGADEAAMVACYRTLKTIAQELAHDLSPDHVEDAAHPATPALVVAVLGATPERAAQTITRMQRAAGNFLARQIHGHHAAGRIGAGLGAGQSETLFRGIALEGDSSPAALIALIHAAIQSQPDAADPASAVSAEPSPLHLADPAPAAAPAPADRASRVSAWDRVAARLEEKFGPASSSKIPASADSHADIPHIEIKPVSEPLSPSHSTPPPATRAAESIPAPQRGESGHPPLAAFVDELRAIDEQCPYAETAEFAIAADGRLHILAHTGNHTSTGHPGGQGRALEELTTASSWAMSHARIFARAHAGLKLDDVEHRPVLHLITDRPREARRLLESDIRVHLVTPVDPHARFVCRDLN